MFAYIESGSHQFRVSTGETLLIDFIEAAKAGDPVTFDRVLLANGGGSSLIGQPVIAGASVAAWAKSRGETLGRASAWAMGSMRAR